MNNIQQILERNPKIIFRILNNKLFLFNESSEDMFCLNYTGNIIWQLLNKRISYNDLFVKIQLSEIDASKDEIDNFLLFLLANNIILSDCKITSDIDSAKNTDAKASELWKFVHDHTGNYYPVTATWEITYKCNQTCIHCYEDCNYTKSMQDLDMVSIKNILSELHKNGCFILTITGGEPLIRKDIFDILKLSKDMNFSVILYSNASLINDSYISKIKELGIAKMCITLFGLDSETHDKIANNKGLHKKTLENIIKIREANIPVRINTPLTKYNFDGYREVVSFAKKMSCEFKITPTITPKDDGNISPLTLCINDTQLETIFLDEEINEKFAEDELSLQDRLNIVPCNVAFSNIAISANGKVYPCNTFKLECGDLMNKSLSSIWSDSDVLNILRTTQIKQIDECNLCPKLAFCLPCPAYSWLENKKIVGKSSICCRRANIQQKINSYY
ncbi:MAG: radical SAM protein [Prevotellaceae bacterium]|jgi:radical SAM protein with 4Fe4S-binding SPASM domain|nr:radical SAM protein [Prevotellaceae bacterium]